MLEWLCFVAEMVEIFQMKLWPFRLKSQFFQEKSQAISVENVKHFRVKRQILPVVKSAGPVLEHP
ncbi:MAG: hypothetical protein MJZ06_05350 [Bacteroidaceae bacterium]|nr:hypothetical protein [Bacteroidaceae bacterium]